MNNEFVGNMIMGCVLSLIIGGIGFAQYKSNILLNVRYSSNKKICKIIGLHVMFFAVVIFFIPFILEVLSGNIHYELLKIAIPTFLILIILLNMFIQIKKNHSLD